MSDEWTDVKSNQPPKPPKVPQQQRHRKIGGSELATLVNLGSFGAKPLDIYERIVDGISSFQGNRYSERGNREEARLRSAYVRYTGASVRPNPGIIYWDECFAASLDDIAVRGSDVIPVDYKTASIKGIKKWNDGPPASYLVQLALYMAVLDAPFAELFAGFGHDLHTGERDTFLVRTCRLWRVERDRAFEDLVLNAGRTFWREHIEPRIPPSNNATWNVDFNNKSFNKVSKPEVTLIWQAT